MTEQAIYGQPEALPGTARWERLRSFFYEELKPQPGRLKGALMRVAGTLLALWVGLALNLPEMGAVLCLAFFGSTRNRAEGKKIAIGVPPAVLIIAILVNLFLNVFGAAPLARTLAFVTLMFGSLYLIHAARAGAIFLMVGIFGKLFLSLWDNGYPAEAIQELQLWIVGDLAVAGLCAATVFTLFGDPEKDPVAEFRNALASRFDLLARFLADPGESSESDAGKLREEALNGRDAILPLFKPAQKAAKKKDSTGKSLDRRFEALVRLSDLLLHQSVVLRAYPLDARLELRETLRWIGSRCKAIARAIQSGGPVQPSPDQPEPVGDPFTSTMKSTVDLAESVLEGRTAPPEDPEQAQPKGFLREDSSTNPEYLNKALRASFAAFLCYFFIAAEDWDGVSTAITTCLLTALTTRVQSRQKQSLRITGAVMGAVLGAILIVYILPAGVGLAGLSIATAIVAFLGAWVYEGGPGLSYAGVQVVLCYLLGVFGNGNGTPTSLVTMRDRVLGILIGNTAMWLFYDGIQPVWTADSARKALARGLGSLGRIAGTRTGLHGGGNIARLLARERKAFLDASSELSAMADPRNLDFSFASDAQRGKAPLIKRVEIQMRQLFSFEFAAAETELLRLSAASDEASSKKLCHSLLSLASCVEGENPIPRREPEGSEVDESRPEILVSCIKSELVCLFSPENRPA